MRRRRGVPNSRVNLARTPAHFPDSGGMGAARQCILRGHLVSQWGTPVTETLSLVFNWLVLLLSFEVGQPFPD